VNGHTQLDAPIQAVVNQVGQVGLVHATQHEGVDLDRTQARARGGLDALQDVTQAITPRNRRVVLTVQRIQGDIDAVQTRIPQSLGALSQAQRIRRQRQVRSLPFVGPKLGTLRDNPFEASAQQRFAARESNLTDTQPLDTDAHEAHNLRVGQRFLSGQPVQTLGGHAVRAAQITAIRQGNAQVTGHSTEGVDEPQRRLTCGRVCHLIGGYKLDRHGDTLPLFTRSSPFEIGHVAPKLPPTSSPERKRTVDSSDENTAAKIA